MCAECIKKGMGREAWRPEGLGVAGLELVTAVPSQEFKTLCEDDSNLSVPTMSAELVTKGKASPRYSKYVTYTAIPPLCSWQTLLIDPSTRFQ